LIKSIRECIDLNSLRLIGFNSLRLCPLPTWPCRERPEGLTFQAISQLLEDDERKSNFDFLSIELLAICRVSSLKVRAQSLATGLCF
jgi:hypothetical protein